MNKVGSPGWIFAPVCGVWYKLKITEPLSLPTDSKIE